MSVDLKALYELQVIDLEIAKAQKTRASLDDGSAKKLQVDAARQQADAANKLLHEARTEMQDKSLNLTSIEEKQKNFRGKLYGGKVTNPKELENIEKEIEMLGRQKGKLEERILELMDIIEERESALSAAQSALNEREKELAAVLEMRRQDDVALSARIGELTAQREKMLPLVDGVLLKRYEASKARAGGVFLSRVEDESCSACHTRVMGGSMRDLKAGKDLVTCENCGRVLYLESR